MAVGWCRVDRVRVGDGGGGEPRVRDRWRGVGGRALEVDGQGCGFIIGSLFAIRCCFSTLPGATRYNV